MTKHEAIEKMNFAGKKGIEFFFLIDFEMQKPQVWTIDELNFDFIKFSFPEKIFYPDLKVNKQIDFQIIPPSKDNYFQSFDIVKTNLLHGNTYLLNLTAKTEIITNLTLEEIFYLSKAKYKLWFRDEFVFFSPEIFVKIKNGKIFSFPMKGTINAEIPDAEQIILNDEKETAEHYTIVDLIRNDLNMVASGVQVEKFRYTDRIKSNRNEILQISSEISGVLPSNYAEKIGNLIFKLLPAGSISGAPKSKTVEIIKTAEKQNREFYTGIAGYFDGENLDSCVIIRYIEKKDNKFFYRSGGGITADSIAEKEYDELLTKIYIPV